MERLPDGVDRNTVEWALLVFQTYWLPIFKRNRRQKRYGLRKDNFNYENKNSFKNFLLLRRENWNPDKLKEAKIKNATAVFDVALKEAEKEGWLLRP